MENRRAACCFALLVSGVTLLLAIPVASASEAPTPPAATKATAAANAIAGVPRALHPLKALPARKIIETKRFSKRAARAKVKQAELRKTTPKVDLAPGNEVQPEGSKEPFRETSGAVAILALDETNGGPEYEMLQAVGVPSAVVSSVDEAIHYRIVIVATTMSSGAMGEKDVDKLLEYAKNGGHVLLEAATSFRFRDALGFTSAVESDERTTLTFVSGFSSLLDANGIDGADRFVALDDSATKAGVGTVGYETPLNDISLKGDDNGDGNRDGAVLARWDDGTAALFGHNYGTGWVATVGARFLDLVTRHQEGARYSPRRGYVNQAGTDADVWLLLLRMLYRGSSAGGMTLGTSPNGTQAAVLPTISANWAGGVTNALGYVQTLRKAGSPATVYVDTHTVNDWLDLDFFPTPNDPLEGAFADTAKSIWAMQDAGAEVASETVAHSPIFNALELGTGDETWKSYEPFVVDRATTKGATVSGELRVSRELLSQFDDNVTSFRAGYLLTPRALPQALDAAGYLYDSSTTQGWVQGAFPFHIPRFDDQGFANVLELPIAVEDEAKPAFASRIDAAEKVILANAQNGAPSTILVHPNDDPKKLDGLARLVTNLKDEQGKALWFGTVRAFGTFWTQRDELTLATYADTASCAGGVTFVIYNRGQQEAVGQSVETSQGAFGGDGGDVYDHAELSDGSSVDIAKWGSIALPPIKAGGKLKGDLCPAQLPDLRGAWVERTDASNVRDAEQEVSAEDAKRALSSVFKFEPRESNGDDAWYTAYGPNGEQITVHTTRGEVCITEDANDELKITPWTCAQVGHDAAELGPFNWTDEKGAKRAVTFMRADAKTLG